jgi:hypothetical protein
MSSPFDNIWESYRKYLNQLQNVWYDWLKTNGNWFVPFSGAVTEFLANGAKLWIPQWIDQDYKKSKRIEF